MMTIDEATKLRSKCYDRSAEMSDYNDKLYILLDELFWKLTGYINKPTSIIIIGPSNRDDWYADLKRRMYEVNVIIQRRNIPNP